jgi:hypothetical protein
MLLIPGWILSILTFPGVIVHEAAHLFFAMLAGVRVHEVVFFQISTTKSGYVVHDIPRHIWQALFISLGPLLINTFLCGMLLGPFIRVSSTDRNFFTYVVMWVGLSVGMHALPSNQDIRAFIATIRHHHGIGLMYFAAHLLLLFFGLVNFLRFLWIDLIYAVIVALIASSLLGIG